jgi:hypothetical protein
VVGGTAVGISPTHPRTGVATLLTYTSLVSGTLSIDYTLWLAFYVGIAHIVSNASAGSSIVSLRAVSIDAT